MVAGLPTGTFAGACYRRRMPWRYDVVGFLGSDFGLAVAARNTVHALSAASRTGRAVSIEPSRPPRELARWLGLVGAVAPSPIGRGAGGPTAGHVALFQMNPMEIAWYARQWRRTVPADARFACVPFWELPLVPTAWVPMLQAMDVILAPTRFVQDACSAVVPPERVLHYPQAVFLPDGIRPATEAWGFPKEGTTFVVSFDAGSDVERKNPWAALDAFGRAFPSDPDVRLVVKTRPWPGGPAHRAQAERFRARVAADGRIRVVDRLLSYPETLGLYASADVMVSLHRSEGLGLHLLEAMTLGKVVVATGWSGNVDFMTDRDSVPVGHRLVPVVTHHVHYLSEVGRAGQVWAEPDVDEAARAMRMLHEHPDRRRAIGGAAEQSMRQRRLDVLSGATFERLEELLARTPRPAGRRDAALRATWRRFLEQNVRAACRRGRPDRPGGTPPGD